MTSSYTTQIEPHFLALLRGEFTHAEARAAYARVPDPADALRAKGATDADLERRPRVEHGDALRVRDIKASTHARTRALVSVIEAEEDRHP